MATVSSGINRQLELTNCLPAKTTDNLSRNPQIGATKMYVASSGVNGIDLITSGINNLSTVGRKISAPRPIRPVKINIKGVNSINRPHNYQSPVNCAPVGNIPVWTQEYAGAYSPEYLSNLETMRKVIS